MTKTLTERLEEMSDAILRSPNRQWWMAASLLMWEAAQALKLHQQAREEIYVSSSAAPDE